MTKVNFLDHHFACLIATILVLTMGANATDDGRKASAFYHIIYGFLFYFLFYGWLCLNLMMVHDHC